MEGHCCLHDEIEQLAHGCWEVSEIWITRHQDIEIPILWNILRGFGGSNGRWMMIPLRCSTKHENANGGAGAKVQMIGHHGVGIRKTFGYITGICNGFSN